MRRGLVNLCLVVLFCVVGATPASAAVGVTVGGTLDITGTAAGETVTLTADEDTITVASPEGVEGACGTGLEVTCPVGRDVTVRAEFGGGRDTLDASTLARGVLVRASDGADTIRTGAGDDSIVLEGEGNQVQAGAGGDVVAATGTVRGEAGNDWLSGDGTLDGGPGDDTLEGIMDAELAGGDGRDSARFTLDGPARISLDGVANDGALLFVSNVHADVEVLRGGSSDDVLAGAAGAQELDGGAGADDLDGGDGADVLDGGAGADDLDGGDGADVLDGGAGADDLDGGDGADVLDGGAGADDLDGGDGADVLDGGAGADGLDGGDGADVLDGGDDADVLSGGPGADVLRGGDGDDELDGHDGEVDDVECGGGTDTARVDAADRTSACELRDAVPVPSPTPDPTPVPVVAVTAPPVAANAAVDLPPTVSVSLVARVARGTFLRHGVVAQVHCSESCTVAAVLTLDARTAKRLKLPRRLARAGGTLAGAGSLRVRVKPTASVRRRLRRVKRTVNATLTTTAIDAAGHARVVTRRLRLSP